jgi:hypothetical protein
MNTLVGEWQSIPDGAWEHVFWSSGNESDGEVFSLVGHGAVSSSDPSSVDRYSF